MKKTSVSPARSSEDAISFKGYRFPSDIISYAVWLYYRFPLSLRMIEEMLAARGIELTYERRCQLRDVVEADARIDSDSKSMRRSLGNVGEFTPLSKVHRELFAKERRAQQMSFECEVLPD